MFNDIQNCRLQNFLKKELHARPEYDYTLRMLANCGSVASDSINGVSIISNGEHSKILGVRTCGHSFLCPYCAPRQMARYSSKIGSAIDALISQQNLAAIMITFTVFHMNQDSLEEVHTLLRKTYEKFTKNASWRRKSSDGSKYYVSSGAWNNFCYEFNIKHKVKCMEINYGENAGWHPHLHNLYFVPKERLKDIVQFEKDLQKQWLKYEDFYAQKIFSADYYQKRKKAYETYWQNNSLRVDGGHFGLHISKDADGNARQIESGEYCCGWGGNNEVTGGSENLKTAHEGHYSLLQLLEKAYEGEQKYFTKYLEAAKTLIKNKVHRVDFSRTGINKIIIQWRNTEGYKEFIKKKKSDLAKKQKTPLFHQVCWFTSKQWQEICYLNDFGNGTVINLILCFARYEDGYELISDLLKSLNLFIPLRRGPYDAARYMNETLGLIAAA